MARPKPPAATIFTWLKNNKIPLGAVTSTDSRALQAAVQVADLWLSCDDRKDVAQAFQKVVLQMQPETRYMAYHSIAHVGDWGHRGELWVMAGLTWDDLKNPDGSGKPECAFGPRRHELPMSHEPEGGKDVNGCDV